MKVFFLAVHTTYVVTFLEAQMGTKCQQIGGKVEKSFKGGCILHPEKKAQLQVKKALSAPFYTGMNLLQREETCGIHSSDLSFISVLESPYVDEMGLMIMVYK